MTSKVLDFADRQGQAAKEAVNTKPAAWSGTLDENEMNKAGGLLLAALTACATQRGHQFPQLAAELGVTYGYIAQLRSGLRQTAQISDDFALACARYLGVPRLTVLMLSGRITPQDHFESDELAANEVNRAFDFICTDKTWGPLMTEELRASSIESRFAVVRLYEKATETVLMKKATNAQTLAAEILKLHKLQEQRKEQVFEASAGRKRGPRKPAAAQSA